MGSGRYFIYSSDGNVLVYHIQEVGGILSGWATSPLRGLEVS